MRRPGTCLWAWGGDTLQPDCLRQDVRAVVEGAYPRVDVGAKFAGRAEMTVIGIFRRHTTGIDYISAEVTHA